MIAAPLPDRRTGPRDPLPLRLALDGVSQVPSRCSLVPWYLSSPRFLEWIDPAEPRAFPGGSFDIAVDSPRGRPLVWSAFFETGGG